MFTFFVLYLYGSFTYDSTLVKQSYTELLLHLTESGMALLVMILLLIKLVDYILKLFLNIVYNIVVKPVDL